MQTPASKYKKHTKKACNNDLRLIFIKHANSNVQSHKAAISVTFNKGHFDCCDYPEGFAHLYEHMLFNASRRYKNTNALDKHLFKHHGQVNGWTENQSTNVQLNCDESGFIVACDILIDRLTAPLFQPEDIIREIDAIDAEFLSQKDNPVRRLMSVQKATCNPSHPFTLFSVGNKQTLLSLSIDETKALLHQYHQNMMQTHHFAICVGLSASNFDKAKAQLEQLLKDKLAQMNKEYTKNTHSSRDLSHHHTKTASEHKLPPIYLQEQLGQLIFVKQQHQEQLICTYIIDKQQGKFADQIDSVFIILSHLIESKHPNGLFDNLLRADYANDVSSYYNSLDTNTFELVISVQLNTKGAKSPISVYAYVQGFIDYIVRAKIEPWRFREKEKQYKLTMDLQRESGLLEQCINQSRAIALTGSPISDSSEQTFSCEYSAQALSHILAHLTPTYARIYAFLKNAKTTNTSPHYQVDYSIQTLANQYKCNTVIFEKPRQNPFMSERQRMVSVQVPSTTLLHLRENQINFKFYQNTQFNKPHGECYISITDPNMHASLSQVLIKRVWLACLNEALQAKFFDVELASIHFRVYAHHHGITLHTGGLSERQLLLCIEIINTIKQFKANKETIARHLQQAKSSKVRANKQTGINILFANLNAVYQVSNFDQDANELLQSLTIEDIEHQQKSYFEHNYVESLVIGNWQVSTGKRFFKQLTSRFTSLTGLTKPLSSKQKLKSGQHIVCEAQNEEQNHLVWHFIPILTQQELDASEKDQEEKTAQTKTNELKLDLAARSLVLEKLLSHTIFKVLRQTHKMGYALGVGYKPVGQFPGIAMYVSSPTHTLKEIESALIEAIQDASKLISSGEVGLKEVVLELIKQVSPQETDINQTAKRAWLHFDDNNPLEAYQELCDALENLQDEHVLLALKVLSDSTLGQLILSLSKHSNKGFDAFMR